MLKKTLQQYKKIGVLIVILVGLVHLNISFAAERRYHTPEQEMAQNFMYQVRAHFTIVDDPVVQSYVQSLGQKLVAHSSERYRKFNFFVVEDDSINAFSGPDGNIGINTGIIMATNSESELASVLAHEITHVTQQHILRAEDKSKGMMLPNIAATAALVAAGMASHSASGANVAAGAAMAGMSGNGQYQVNTIRGYEEEADRIGIKVLYLSGFDPFAMPELFERLERQSFNSAGDVPAILIDHPVTDARIADAKNRAEQYPKHKVLKNFDYYLVKARLKAFLSENNYRIGDYFKVAMQNQDAMQRDAARYGYTLLLLHNIKLHDAEANIRILTAKYPGNAICQITLSEINNAAQRNDKALAIAQQSLVAHPDYYPAIIRFAEALLAAQHYATAENFLTAQTQNYPDDMIIYQLLSMAQAKNGHLAAAYQSRAKIYNSLGYSQAAEVQLEQAKKHAQ